MILRQLIQGDKELERRTEGRNGDAPEKWMPLHARRSQH